MTHSSGTHDLATRDARIDAARALAIAGVVLVHSAAEARWGVPDAVAALAGMGRLGVQLFFVISGFLLASIYPSTSMFNWKSFAIRRVGRIYPLYFSFALLWALVAICFTPMAGYFSTGIFVMTLLLLNDLWWKSAWGFLPGAWSISAEALHYLTFLFLRAAQTRVLGWTFLLLSGLSTAAGMFAWSQTRGDYLDDEGQLWSWVNTLAPWNTLPYFVAGILLVKLSGLPWLKRLSLPDPAGWLALSLVVAGVGITAFVGSLAPIALGFVILSFVVVVQSRWTPWGWLQWVGRRSYGTYFTHFIVLAILGLLLPDLELNAALATFALCLLAAFVLLVGSILSEGLWIALERRGIAWSRRVSARYLAD